MAARRVRGFTVGIPIRQSKPPPNLLPLQVAQRDRQGVGSVDGSGVSFLRAEHGSLIAFDACWRGRSRLPKAFTSRGA